MLFGIYLRDYELSFRNVPASVKSRTDDNDQGDEGESGVEATGLETKNVLREMVSQ